MDEPPGYMITPMLKCVTPWRVVLCKRELVVKKQYI